MSKATVVLVMCSCWFIACAMGGSATHQGQDANQAADAPAGPHDASHAGGDASPPHDARPVDAFVQLDAQHFGSDGDLCAVNSDCDANQGLCCYFFSCSAGTGVGSNICFPAN